MSEKKIAETVAAAEEPNLVRIYHLNRTGGALVHGPHRLNPGEHADVPKEIADVWLSQVYNGGPVCGLREDVAPTQTDDKHKAALEAKQAEVDAANSETEKLAERVKALEAQLAAAAKKGR